MDGNSGNITPSDVATAKRKRRKTNNSQAATQPTITRDELAARMQEEPPSQPGAWVNTTD